MIEKERTQRIKFKIKAFDIDEDAVNVSKRNIKKMNIDEIDVEKKDIFSFLSESLDDNTTLIISNPPYIPVPRNTFSDNLICIDGGEFGTKYTIPIIRFSNVKYIAIQTGSISDPSQVIEEIFKNGFNIRHINVIETKFGIYTKRNNIKKHLKKLSEINKSYFYDNKYLILGFILEKSKNVEEGKIIKEELLEFLSSYSENGLKDSYILRVPFKMDFMRYKNTL